MNDTIDRDEAMRELVTMTADEARDFRQAHDTYARELSRLPKARLALRYGQQLASRGVVLLGGGPVGKDELISALMRERFPLDRLNESIHVLYHQDSDGWSACEHCHPHSGGTCDCALGRGAPANADGSDHEHPMP